MRDRIPLAIGVLVVLAATLVILRCAPAGSHLTIYNRTEVTLVFAAGRGDRYVAPCSTSTFTWTGAWNPDPPVVGSASDAARITVLGAPIEGDVQLFIVVAPRQGDNQQVYSEADVHKPLPTCAGVPYSAPSPPPETPGPTTAPLLYEPEVVGIVAAVQERANGTTYELQDGRTITATPNWRYLGGLHPAPGDLFLSGARPDLWIDLAAPALEQPGAMACYVLVGVARADASRVYVGRNISSGPALVVLTKSPSWTDPVGIDKAGLLPGAGICLDRAGEAFAAR